VTGTVVCSSVAGVPAPFGVTLAGRSYAFADLRTLLAKASPRRSGDELAGVAAESQEERVAAQLSLAEVPLTTLLDEPIVPWEIDDVSRLIRQQHDPEAFAPVRSMCVGELREWLLAYDTTTDDLTAVARGLTPEMVAAVSKVMGNQDLVLVAGKCSKVTAFRSTIGLPGRLSVRLQPNHPADDPLGVLASIIDGLSFGCGDAVIGVNPALDSPQHCRRLLEILDEVINRFAIPTQSCVLTHVTSTLQCIEEGAPVDLVFQSIAGTEATNRSFGVTLDLLAEARDAAMSLQRGTVGSQVMYFETGQGSCLSAGGHHGVDQQTLETRAYAVAREFDPLLVNSVVGFIGPEYLLDGKQVIRAGLEDHFSGKLLGLPMGCDVCYTNHMDADQDDMDVLLTLLGAAGCNFVMGVPGADDVMLGYQSTSYHDAQYVRQLLGLRPAPEFEHWLQHVGVTDDRGRLRTANDVPALFAALEHAGRGSS
jgi:ethanolamine ammonia-lyase large subunit